MRPWFERIRVGPEGWAVLVEPLAPWPQKSEPERLEPLPPLLQLKWEWRWHEPQVAP